MIFEAAPCLTLRLDSLCHPVLFHEKIDRTYPVRQKRSNPNMSFPMNSREQQISRKGRRVIVRTPLRQTKEMYMKG